MGKTNLEISSRKLEIPWEHFMQRWAQWREWYEPNRSRRYYEGVERIHMRTTQKRS